MNGDVDAAVEQRVFELFGEHSLAANHGERIVLYVAGGFNDLDLNVDLRIQKAQARARLFSLPQCEFGTARTDDEGSRHRRSVLQVKTIFGEAGGVRLARFVKTTHLVDDRM